MGGYHWTEEEIKIVQENYGHVSCKVLAEQLGRTETAVEGFARHVLGIHAPKEPKSKSTDRRYVTWSQEDLDFLEDRWGEISIKAMASALHRTVRAVETMRIKLGYVANKNAMEYLSKRQIYEAVTGKPYYHKVWWVENLPTRRATIKNTPRRAVRLDDFWKFAEEHKDRINFGRMEPFILGAEPEWLEQKRKDDFAKLGKPPVWTDEKKQRLAEIAESGGSLKEAAEIFHSSVRSIRYACDSMNIKMPCSPGGKILARYSDEDMAKIQQMIVGGCSKEDIAEAVGRTKAALISMLDRRYHTHSREKLKEMFESDHREDA